MRRAVAMIDEVQELLDGLPPNHQAMFERVSRLIAASTSDAELIWSYKMPAFRVGKRRLYVGAWKHGISFYGWDSDRDAGFSERHPDLLSGKGTIRLRPEDAASIDDEELGAFLGAALAP